MEEKHPKGALSRAEASSPSPETSLSWCLVQLTGADPKPPREADKRLRAGQWRALVAIRTHHIKGGSSSIRRYQAQGGLPPLLAILSRPESSRKILDLTLSILANCCTETETRAEVRKLDGVSVVGETSSVLQLLKEYSRVFHPNLYPLYPQCVRVIIMDDNFITFRCAEKRTEKLFTPNSLIKEVSGQPLNSVSE